MVVFDLGLERWTKGGQLSSRREQSAGLSHGWQVLQREWSLGCGKGTIHGAECVSKGNLPGANGKARVDPHVFPCAVRTGPTGEGPGLGPKQAGGGSACLRAQRGCGYGAWLLLLMDVVTGQWEAGVGSVSRLWQGVLLGVRKECHITIENRKIIHFHIRGYWTVAPPLSFNNLDQQPKKQHVKKKSNWRHCSK